MHPKTRHKKLLSNPKVKRWYENLDVKSQITSEVYLRNLGLWLEAMELDPESVIKLAKNDFNEFKGQVADRIRQMEREGKAGSYIATSEKALISFLKFNNIIVKLGINIKDENRNLNAEREVIPTIDQLSSILRRASLRERVSISLIAFSGVRPEVLGNVDGSDGLLLSDIPDIEIADGIISAETVPLQVKVRPELSKTRQSYITFLGSEGTKYLIEYLEDRKRNGEKLSKNSALILPDDTRRGETNKFLMTTLILRRIKFVITKAGFT